MKTNNFSNAEILKTAMNEADEFDKEAKLDKGLLIGKTANEWLEEASKMPIPKQLFGNMLNEGEVSILFADTKRGKSILAVQVADSIAKGTSIPPLKMEAEPQSVIYFDAELSTKQFQKRYSNNYKDNYKFPSNFIRLEFNQDAEYGDDANFQELLITALKLKIEEYKAKIVIIDNITYFNAELEKSAGALGVIKALRRLASNLNLTILSIAHTPKVDLARALTVNCLAGSKQLSNTVDSIFAIGGSCKDKSLRYVKQIVARNSEMLYDSDNVLVFEICKEHNFLKFEFVEFGNESDHLKTISFEQQTELEENILSLKESNPNLSLRKIADQLGTNQMKVKRTLERNNL